MEKIHKARDSLEYVIDQLGDDQLIIPGVENNWTVKDILAHIIAWEKKMCNWLNQAENGEIPERPAPGLTWDDLDSVNLQIFEDNKDRPLAEILKEFKDSFNISVKAVNSLSEEQLFDPDYFFWRKGNPLWHMVGGNTFWHYQEHEESILKWLQNKN